MSAQRRRLVIGVAVLVIASSTLTACGYAFSGGVIGVLGVAALLAGLLLTGATQAGCNGDDGPPDADIGPCLSIPPPPDAAVDADIGPCLSIPPPDASVDAGADASMLPDESSGDELSVADQRARAIDRLRDRLPADVVDRLEGGLADKPDSER